MPGRLYPGLRKGADYRTSLGVLSYFSSAGKLTKTGFMVGLGETRREIELLVADIASAGTRILTVGQYLQPSKRNCPVERYYEKDEFEEIAGLARRAGIPFVVSGPFVRSSYRAGELFEAASPAGRQTP